MTYVVTPAYSGIKIASAVVTDIVNMPGAGALSYIHRTGSTFITSGVVPGDGAIITGSGAGNNGSHLIVDIPDEEILIVRANLTNETGVASVEVQNPQHTLRIEDVFTLDWATIASNVNERAYIHRYKLPAGSAGTEWYLVQHSLSAIDIVSTTPSQSAVWTSKREWVTARYQTTANWSIRTELTNVVDVHLILGELTNPSDNLSYKAGAVWNGFIFGGVSASLGVSLYGSMIIGYGTTVPYAYDGGKIFGTILVGSFDVASGTQTGAGVEFQDVIQYGEAGTRPLFVVDNIASMNNVTITNMGLSSFFILGAPAVFQDVALGDTLPAIPFSAVIQDIDFRDLRKDREISTIVSIAGSSTDTRVSYTYNPIFADDEGLALNGAQVQILRFNDATPATKTPISGSPFTTDVNGQINAGVGVVMEIQHRFAVVFPTITDDRFSYEIIVEYPGFQQYREIIKPRVKFDGTIGLRRYEPALEGEEATL